MLLKSLLQEFVPCYFKARDEVLRRHELKTLDDLETQVYFRKFRGVALLHKMHELRGGKHVQLRNQLLEQCVVESRRGFKVLRGEEAVVGLVGS